MSADERTPEEIAEGHTIEQPCDACTAEAVAAERLEELRVELRAERISYGELAELQGLARYIDASDVELLEAAGVPETAPDYADDIAMRFEQADGNGFTDVFTPEQQSWILWAIREGYALGLGVNA